MDGAAVEQIVGLSRHPVMVGDVLLKPSGWTAEDPAALVKAGPQAKVLPVHSLGAVRDYLAANRDALDLAKVVVHVAGPSKVALYGPLAERARSREQFVEATCADLTDGWLNRFVSMEDFLIGLQIRFADADDRKRVLGLLSTVKNEKVQTAMDDGMTQTVTARAGVALVSDVAVPNPVLLCAYRTFRDVIQPSSLFVLRVNQGKAGGLPEAGLFEADGGAWRLTAIERVKNWLVDALPKDVAVLA